MARKLGYNQLHYDISVWKWGAENGYKTPLTKQPVKPTKEIIPRSVILRKMAEKLQTIEDKTDFLYNYISLRN